MDMNELRRLLASGEMAPEDMQAAGVPNELARMLMPMPTAPNVPPMQQNTMRVESGPDAGKVTSLDFTNRMPPQTGQNQANVIPSQGGMTQNNPQERRTMQVIGMGNGTQTNLQPEFAPPQVNIDRSRAPVDIMGAKGYYSKDEPGVAYIMGPDGQPAKKVILGYDMQGSMALNQHNLAMDAARSNIAHVNAETADIGSPKYQLTPNGDVFNPKTGQVVASGVATGKALTESQGKATGLASRAQAAHDILLGLESKGVMTPSLIKQGAEAVPLVGGALGMAVNKLGIPSDDQQSVEQAQRDFVNAALRVESGASISQSEFDNARKQYFPQPGDSPQVIQQKQEARSREIASLGMQAGPGAAQIHKQAQPQASGADRARILFDAKKAIAAGAPRAAVVARLQSAGINDSGL